MIGPDETAEGVGGASSGHSQAEVYRSLQTAPEAANESDGPEATGESEGQRLAAEFSARAQDIFFTIERANASRPEPGSAANVVETGSAIARQAYVEDEEDERLREFGQFILQIHDVTRESRELSELTETRRAQRQAGRRPTAEEQTRYTRLATRQNQFREDLQDIILDADGALSHKEVISWFSRANPRSRWGESVLVPRVAAEVAAYQYFSAKPDVKRVIFSSDEGLKHNLEVELGGQDHPLAVRAIPGAGSSDGYVLRRGGSVEMSIPMTMLSNFQIKAAAVPELDVQLKQALDGPDTPAYSTGSV